jgi:multicomponent Na+:H+ antiporter subunit G
MFDIIIYILLFLGIFFNLLGALGILRFPDVYTRLHAGTKCTTFGSIYLIGSVVLLGLKQWYDGSPDGSVLAIHSIVALAAILITNPTGAHAIARAAHKSGVVPVKVVVDHLQEDSKPSKKPTKEKTKPKTKPTKGKEVKK